MVQSTPPASFWREAIGTYKITQKITSYLERREKVGDEDANPDRDPSFWACISNPSYNKGNFAGESLESERSDWSISKLVEFLEYLKVVSGRIKSIEGIASQLLDQYPEDSEKFAFFAPPFAECGRIQFKSRDFHYQRLEKAIAGWKGRWVFSYDCDYKFYSVTFLRRAARKDFSGVAWMAPTSLNSPMTGRHTFVLSGWQSSMKARTGG